MKSLCICIIAFFSMVASVTAVENDMDFNCDGNFNLLDFLILNEKVGQEYDEPFLVKGWPIIEWYVKGEMPVAATRHCFVDSRLSSERQEPRLLVSIGPVTVKFDGRTASVNEIAVWRVTESRDYFATFYYEDVPGINEAEIEEALLASSGQIGIDPNQDGFWNPEDLEALAKAMPPPKDHLNDFDWLANKDQLPPLSPAELTPKRPKFLPDGKLAVSPAGKLASAWGALKTK